MKNTFLYIFLTLSFLSKGAFASEDIYSKAKQLWQDAIKRTGTHNNMKRRAKVLLELYSDSNKNFPFALSISHLTLAIESSSHPDEFRKKLKKLRLEKMSQDLRFWGSALRKINQSIVSNLLFAYNWSYYLHDNRISPPSFENILKYAPSMKKQFSQTLEIMPVMMEIHKANDLGIQLSQHVLDRHFQKLVRWEHIKIVQHKLEDAFSRLNKILRFSLKHVPGRTIEKLFLSSIFSYRSTLNLQCFNEEVFLHTKNFMNFEDRIKQATKFYELLKDIDFDPELDCYNDPYYITGFEEEYLDQYRHL